MAYDSPWSESETSTLVGSPRGSSSTYPIKSSYDNGSILEKTHSNDLTFFKAETSSYASPLSSKDADHEISWLGAERKRAIELQTQCQFEKAGECYDAILKACFRLFGNQDLRILTAKEDVAVSLAHRGFYEQAQELFEVVLKERKAQLNGQRLDTLLAGHLSGHQRQEYLANARAYYNLANVQREQDLED